MSLECTVAVICPHYQFQEKAMKSHNVFGMYSSGNVPILYVTIIHTTTCLDQVRNVGGVAGLKGRNLCVVW
jgi:hypothetical protein